MATLFLSRRSANLASLTRQTLRRRLGDVPVCQVGHDPSIYSCTYIVAETAHHTSRLRTAASGVATSTLHDAYHSLRRLPRCRAAAAIGAGAVAGGDAVCILACVG